MTPSTRRKIRSYVRIIIFTAFAILSFYGWREWLHNGDPCIAAGSQRPKSDQCLGKP